MSVEILPIDGLPEFESGDDLGLALAGRLREIGVADGDVVVVTQKAISKCEGRVVPLEPEGRAAWLERETRRVVARRGDLIIAETHHGLVCANAGIDESNVAAGMLSLLPVDPDGSARGIRQVLADSLGVEVAVIVTDTFGRPWRGGVVNVAIGSAGISPLMDLRGTHDSKGRVLEATVVAIADELAASSGLVIGKADGIPAALVRGITATGDGTAAELIRDRAEDMFRYSPLEAIRARRTVRSFATGDVPRECIETAVKAAISAPAPHHTQPWMFVSVDSTAGRSALLSVMADAWRADLTRDGVPADAIEGRVARSHALLGQAPTLIVPLVRTSGAHTYPDAERNNAERDMFLLSAGAAIQNLLLGLWAQGIASSWISSTIFCREEVLIALDLDDSWLPMGTVAAGWPAEDPPDRPIVDESDFLRYR